MSDEQQPQPQPEKQLTGRGGPGRGQGRKPNMVRREETIRELEDRYFTGKRLKDYLVLLDTMARNEPEPTEVPLGTKGGTVIINRRPYDGKIQMGALNSLLDRGMGKAVQRSEISGPDGNPLAVLPQVRMYLNGRELQSATESSDLSEPAGA